MIQVYTLQFENDPIETDPSKWLYLIQQLINELIHGIAKHSEVLEVVKKIYIFSKTMFNISTKMFF